MGRCQPPEQLDLSRAATVRLFTAVQKALRLPRQREPEPEPERAVLWLPADRQESATQACLDWCAHRGYEVIGCVVDDGQPARWHDVVAMLVSGEAQIVLAADPSHLPAGRTPRSEVVGQVFGGVAAPRQRRPKVVRRPEK